jgi:hypothetical protein
MKIFAKRKRKATATSSPSTDEKTLQSAADAVVEDLLKQDPATWNAKHRRLVKRYRERKGGDENESEKIPDPSAPPKTDGDRAHGELGSSRKEVAEAQQESQNHKDDDNDDSDDCASSNGDDDSAESGSDDSTSSSEGITKVKGDVGGDNVDVEATKTTPKQVTTTTQSDDGSKQTIDSDLQAQLNTLNAKQRRTLVRKFERDGDQDSLRAEVSKLLPKDDANKAEEGPSKKKRRRGKEIDWNALPEDERMRREEQRRVQQEAAKARAEGKSDETNHKHPLNSERRRANRRKPKWERKRNAKNEHNTSGYHMRKVVQGAY